jgi:hypothetical protein
VPPLPPSAVLSESFQEHLEGKRVKTAVFFTFSFDPAFFEQQILPVFLDVPLSQTIQVRLVQLEAELRERLNVAVYYDPRGLVDTNETPRLDIRRIPVAMQGGYFHAKNIFLICEPDDGNDDSADSLIVATLSANLTEDGWWRNVECCHVETVEYGASIGFRGDLLELFAATRKATSQGIDHGALEKVRKFVDGCGQRDRVTDDRMPTRLFGGRTSFVKFLSEETKGRLHGLNLEVIAPYVDNSDAAPLKALLEEFSPRECRVLLPRNHSGSVACSEAYYECVRKLQETCWAVLPKTVLQSGRTENARDRLVHAKVYRFFHPNRRYEAIVVGSVNLTGAAHNKGGNLESAFVVEPELTQVPDWWLSRADGKKPTSFVGADEDEDATSKSPAIWLLVTYNWRNHSAEAWWQGSKHSPAIGLSFAGIHRLHLDSLSPGERRPLAPAEAASIRAGLDTTALCMASVQDAEDGPLLVREEGMDWKPSILLSLSVADILRYWSALSPEQRLAILEDVALRDPVLSGLPAAKHRLTSRDSFFDNFAQIFQAFDNVSTAVTKALDAGRESEAIQRLLGDKYDSLPCLLDRVFHSENQTEPVSRYLITLCARQTLEEVKRASPEFARANRLRFDELIQRTKVHDLRDKLSLSATDKPIEFLDWFEKWFVLRAEPKEST